ncbi:MAG TPA: SBBP repeat-containing protein [Chitinophagaceae bacterium]|nr:SBBP repeat-containing protein [Chitinophagaceae bacterium]
MKKILLTMSALAWITATQAQVPLLKWAKGFGGGSADYANNIVVDADGNSYVTGSFQGTVDFDAGAGVHNLSSNGGSDAFIVKLDANGNFLWVKNFGSSDHDEGFGLATDVSGNVYLSGSFEGTVDFDPGPGAVNSTSAGASDAFLIKLNASGDILWYKTFGGSGADVATALMLDASANIYLGGNFRNTADFDPGSGTESMSSLGLSDMFVVKLDASGSFVWARRMGGLFDDNLSALSLDVSGNVLLAGSFSGVSDMNPGAGTDNLVSNGLNDAFLLQLDASGSYMWARQFGGLFDDHASDIAVDASGKIYLAGYFNNIVVFDPGSGSNLLTSLGLSDGFVLQLDASGNFSWVRKMGGLLADNVNSIATDLSGNVYVTGAFQGNADFGTGTTLSSVGQSDVFISRIDLSGNFIWTKNIGSSTDDYGNALVVNNAGNIYTTGVYSGKADFGLGLGLFDMEAPGGGSDMFTQRLAPSGTLIEDEGTLSTVLPYPNPNNGIFSFMLAGDAAVEIYSEAGLLVYSQVAGRGLNKIDVSNQPNGMYFVKMTSGDIVENHSLVKF